ncbi:hypothetical protein [Nonomuraea sp. NPDC049709]|uniref:hypothetical protein n=1 Tax=Nonomuraea sp. NPDC049709 TaxID=3154736 RepID=UPI00343C07F3
MCRAVPMAAVPLSQWLGPVAALLLAGAVFAGGAIPGVRRAAFHRHPHRPHLLTMELRRA